VAPVVVDLRSQALRPLLSNESALSAHIRGVLLEAERSSTPVVLRGTEDILKAMGFEALEELCAAPEFPISDALRVYEPGLDAWGQMRDAEDGDIERLLDLLPAHQRGGADAESATIAHFVKLATRHAAALESANLSSVTMSSMFPKVHCTKLSRLIAGHAYPPPYYRLFTDWGEGKHYVFVSPRTSRMGAHIDVGGSYFMLRVHRGRKLVRLWPVYGRTSPLGLPPPTSSGANEIDRWVLAQQTEWPASVDPLVKLMGCVDPREVEHPCEPFLEDRWRPSPRAATTALADAAAASARPGSTGPPERRLGAGADAHKCFVEVDLREGDELFVPSDTPHQVTTLEPTLSSSVNFFPP